MGCSNTGSDERAECLCTSKPLGQAPVGAHQPEVITAGVVEEVEEGVGLKEGEGRLQGWEIGCGS